MTEPYGHYDFSDNDIPAFDDDDYDGLSPHDVLKKYWGYDNFRPLQLNIINSILAGRDTIGLLPTGGGKSITFQVPAMLLPGLTVVITPLVSLMKDQVDGLRRRHVPAACLFMGMTKHEQDFTLEKIRQGRTKLLYVAPERLGRPQFIAFLRTIELSMIVVDEAHCISQWGYDFRPSYLRISDLREQFPSVPVLALTASATPEVVADIADKLSMKNPAQFSLSFARDNISFLVRRTEAKMEKLLQVLSSVGGSTIIYVRSRKRCKEISDHLNTLGFDTTYYHAGLEAKDKSQRQDAWQSGAKRIIVATTAFGMGIDKPDVRLVVHIDIPSTLEEYYQEAGRAGRDGQPSLAVMICSERDRATLKKRLSTAFPPRDYIAKVYDEVCRFLSVPMGEGFDATFDFSYETMCIRYRMQPAATMNAIQILDRAEYWNFIEAMDTRARIMFRCNREDLYYAQFTKLEEDIINHLLRNYPGLFSDFVFINEESIAYHLRIPVAQVYEALIALGRQHTLHYIPHKFTPYLQFKANRCESSRLIIEKSIYEDRRAQMAKRLDSMENFIFDDSGCRVARMLRYFGQHDAADCGKCDICRARRLGPPSREQVIAAIEANSTDGRFDIRRIPSLFTSHPKAAADEIKSLIDDKIYRQQGLFISKA